MQQRVSPHDYDNDAKVDDNGPHVISKTSCPPVTRRATTVAAR
jgi:hypothetical protein